MESKGIRWGDVLRQRRMPCDLLCFWDQVERRSRQGRHVQHLADMAGRLRTIMVVEDRAAGGKIKQRHAAQDGQRAPHTSLPEK
jgi:hypothetical protein